MNPEQMFGLANLVALPGWAILALAPRRWPLLNMVPAIVIPLALSALYAGLMLSSFADASGGFGSLAEVRLLFSQDVMLLAGWVHYLAFDLIVGSLMAVRLDQMAISRLIQAPILITIFLFGPVGVLLTLLMRAALRVFRPQVSA